MGGGVHKLGSIVPNLPFFLFVFVCVCVGRGLPSIPDSDGQKCRDEDRALKSTSSLFCLVPTFCSPSNQHICVQVVKWCFDRQFLSPAQKVVGGLPCN